MANEEHLAMLKNGVEAWNRWMEQNPQATPDFSKADLSGMYLLRRVNFNVANLVEANLNLVNLGEANLRYASLIWADLTRANLYGADLTKAELCEANLSDASLMKADLTEADLSKADLRGANLSGANLTRADLSGADLSGANLTQANLTGADLTRAVLVQTNIEGVKISNCHVYGIAVWNLKGNPGEHSNLVITPNDEPAITVDDLEVAQFIYLLLNNQKIRNVIDTVTSKAVLILGRFTPQRKAVLDAIRQELRKRDYLPILFDFDVPGDRDVTETITLLARMARFIIADLTESSSIPKELEAIVPTLAIPVQPLLQGSTRPYSMFKDYWKYEWVLKVHRYEDLVGLSSSLNEMVIAPAEAKVQELEKKRMEASP